MTIDISELRRLAQAALIGPDGVSMRWLKLLKDFQEEANPSEVLEILDHLEAAENENAKLRIALAEKVTSETTLRDLSVGNGSINATFEGGAVQLMVDALADQFVESGASNYIEMQFHSKATGPLLFTLQRVDGKTPHQLRAEAEQERDWHAERCEDAMNECDALRAKVAEMEKQEPVGCVESLFDDFVIIHHNFDRAAPVYFAPGAQPAPSVPMDVIADYLVSISAHLAHRDDAKAQAEIGELLKMIASAPKPAPTIAEQDQINAEAAIRSIYGAQPVPSVPEGYKLTPINPDHQMLTAGNRWANGLAYETYVAMITAAPEVKP